MLQVNGQHNHQARSVPTAVVEMDAPTFKGMSNSKDNQGKINPKIMKTDVAQPESSKRKAYLLVTMYRSGSTLTGEMFNRNPDFLYYFEVDKYLKINY